MRGTLLFFCRVVVIMRIGVPPPNINKVVLLRDLFVSLVYLALYLVVLCNRCFQFTSIIEPSSLTRINLVFHRLQVWVFVSVNYATLGLATCLASNTFHEYVGSFENLWSLKLKLTDQITFPLHFIYVLLCWNMTVCSFYHRCSSQVTLQI